MKFNEWLEKKFGESPDVCPYASHYVSSGQVLATEQGIAITADELKWSSLNEYIIASMNEAFDVGVKAGQLEMAEIYDNELKYMNERLSEVV